MNRWGIPDWLEREARLRDVHCVYCGVELLEAAKDRRLRPSWEHIINDASVVTRENIDLCCISCNASKGARELPDGWSRTTAGAEAVRLNRSLQ